MHDFVVGNGNSPGTIQPPVSFFLKKLCQLKKCAKINYKMAWEFQVIKKHYMKQVSLTWMILAVICCSCINSGKDSIEKADSANDAKLDTGLNRNTIVIDEASSSFLVRVANGGMAEEVMASYAHEHAFYEDVKGFAAMLHHDHAAVNEMVKGLASRKNITLPATVSVDKQNEINSLQNKTGKYLDREFLNTMIKNHETGIDMFENAMLDAKDPDVRSFADKTLPTLRIHLDSARSLQKRYRRLP